MAAVGQETVSTFMDALKGVGKDKMTSDALIGGAAGIGLNMGANMASGDSGGYVGAAALGGGGGALARAAVKHFDLGPALESTFSKARGLNNFTKSTSDEVDKGAQKIFRNRDGSEGSISAYEDRIAAMQRQSEKQNSKGSPILANSTYQESLALGRRAEELKYNQYSNSVMRHGAGNDELVEQYGQESLDRYSSRLGRETKGKFGTPPPREIKAEAEQWSPGSGGGHKAWDANKEPGFGSYGPLAGKSPPTPLQTPEGYSGNRSPVNIGPNPLQAPQGFSGSGSTVDITPRAPTSYSTLNGSDSGTPNFVGQVKPNLRLITDTPENAIKGSASPGMTQGMGSLADFLDKEAKQSKYNPLLSGHSVNIKANI